jgi:spore germination protein YaaH
MDIQHILETLNTEQQRYSVGTVAQSLKDMALYVPGEMDSEEEVTLSMGIDSEGKTWLYAYTSLDQLEMANSEDEPSLEIAFPDLIGIARVNEHLAGININSASDVSFCLIPRGLFEEIEEILEG